LTRNLEFQLPCPVCLDDGRDAHYIQGGSLVSCWFPAKRESCRCRSVGNWQERDAFDIAPTLSI